MPLLLAPRYWGAHLLMVLALAAAVGLGIWQYHAWEAGRAADAHDLTEADPKPLATVMSGDDPFPGQYVGQPVTFRGTWLPAGTLYVADRTLHGKKGYWVMTPVLIGKSAMPVVRGWSATPHVQAPTGSVAVHGWLQPSEDTDAPDNDPQDDIVPEMNIADVVQHVDADLYSGFVLAGDLTGPGATGSTDLEKVTPAAVPKVSGVSHLRNFLYAFQWWVFGGFAVYIWYRWCRDTVELAQEVDREGDPDGDPEGDEPEKGLVEEPTEDEAQTPAG